MRILRVLIAEADPLLQKLYSDLIATESAFTVLKCVSSGTQMFESLRCVEADLVLLDLYLKDFNALEGLDQLRKEFPRTDFIVASSGEDPNLVRKALCQGVFEYLIKPCSFACRGERLARAGSGPDRSAVRPSCGPKGSAPDADSGEEVALGVSQKVGWSDIFNASGIHVAGCNVTGFEEVA